MDNYAVKLLARAERDLNSIYRYIAQDLSNPTAADRLADELEQAVLSLAKFPNRGAMRRTGAYANKGYRQLFVESFTIVYRIDEKKRHIIIVTVKYMRNQF